MSEEYPDFSDPFPPLPLDALPLNVEWPEEEEFQINRLRAILKLLREMDHDHVKATLAYVLAVYHLRDPRDPDNG